MPSNELSPSSRPVRVLIALDSAHPNGDALRILGRLLQREDLDVTGLYVEDEDVLRAAALPGLREITFSGEASALSPERLAGDMVREAAAARQSFDALVQRVAGEHARLHHRFLVARGKLVEEVSRAAAESDVVMVTRTLRVTGLRPRQGRTFAALVNQPRHMLFVNEPWASGSAVVVLPGSQAAVDHAARLADAERLKLVVADIAGAPQLELPAQAEVRRLLDREEQSIAELCLAEDARVLVLPELEGVNWTELLVSLMDKLPCSLLKLASSSKSARE